MEIRLDEEKMDMLLVRLRNVSSQADECYVGLRQLYSELLEDGMMQMIPETHLAIGDLERAAAKLYTLRDRLEVLTQYAGSVSGEYKDKEKTLMQQVQELTLSLDAWSVGAATVGLPGYDTVVGGQEQGASVLNQTSGSMELSNLGMLKSAVEGQYGKTEE